MVKWCYTIWEPHAGAFSESSVSANSAAGWSAGRVYVFRVGGCCFGPLRGLRTAYETLR
jgi:hypothetical protein